MSFEKAISKAPHLAAWPLPPWLKAAINEIGQAEVSGAKSNPRILEYRKMAGLTQFGAMDDGVVPWCAIFINGMLAKAGVKASGSAMARSFVKHPDFIRLEEPCVGCITVISSSRGPASGHVFFYVGENPLFFVSLGGNEDDAVSCGKMWQKAKLVGHFWPRGLPLPPAPFDKPVKINTLPQRKAVRDA